MERGNMRPNSEVQQATSKVVRKAVDFTLWYSFLFVDVSCQAMPSKFEFLSLSLFHTTVIDRLDFYITISWYFKNFPDPTDELMMVCSMYFLIS